MSIGETVLGQVCTCRDIHAHVCLKHPNAKTERTDEMLKLWFEENVGPHLPFGTPRSAFAPKPEDFVASFRDYFSVRLRDVLPPHPISEKLEELR